MVISTLRISHFRNLAAVEIFPLSSGLNLICGNNGSGKTSILEAIHYLALGKSFRTSSNQRIIQHGADKFSLFAQLVTDSGRNIPVGMERTTTGDFNIRVAEKDTTSISDITTLLPVRVIDSHSHQLFEAGPVFRRKYLDWGLFYQCETFINVWRQYERVLKQRNAILRERRSKVEISVWTAELVRYGVELDKLRQDYIEMIKPLVRDAASGLLQLTDLDITYDCGWDPKLGFAEALENGFFDEIRAGYTLYGPHRADFDVTINAVSVKHFLSRGQQKLLICAMILAQGMSLARHANKSLIYLVDDLPAELDLQSRMKLISLLSMQKTQIFITAIEKETICDVFKGDAELPVKVFHVEHGAVVEKAD